MSTSTAAKAKRQEQKRLYYAANRERIRERNREYWNKKWKGGDVAERNRHVRNNKVKRLYGLTRVQLAEMYEAQEHRCAICNVHESELNQRLCIDHDHTTGKIRALLCHYCNVVIGQAREKIEVLESAISYLRKHADVH